MHRFVMATFALPATPVIATIPRSRFFIEAVDPSGDGKPEAIVTEGNTATSL
jgi:hypothetical protein